MKAKNQLFVLVCLLMAGTLFPSCEKKGEPSQVGELLTTEQIKALPADDSWNMKLVAIDGYMSHCRRLSVVNLGSKNKVTITTEPSCEGEKLIEVKVFFQPADRTDIPLGGIKSRNFLTMSKEKPNLEDSKFTLDDYEVVDYQKMRISGELIYDNGSYYLDHITLHTIK